MEKSCRKCEPNASARPLFILVNNPNHPLHARNSFKNKIFQSRIIKKLKNVDFTFSFEPSPF